VGVQRPVDHLGGAQRRGGFHGAGVLFGSVHRAAGMVAIKGTPGHHQADGRCAELRRLRAGGRGE